MRLGSSARVSGRFRVRPRPSPKITWSGAPANTAAYTVLFHDPDPVLGGSATNDVMHWMIFDIPGTATGLPEGVAKGDLPDGSKQVSGFAGNGYMGPCAPPGHAMNVPAMIFR